MDPRVLLVEDDEALGAQIEGQLRRAGFDVTWAKSGRAFSDHDPGAFGMIVLDLMLPDAYGLDLLKDLRSRSDVPVLILSARNDTSTRVRGLKLGADDYLTKPFWPEELVERVRARLRRPILQREGAIEIGALKIDLHARLVSIAGKTIALTGAEFGILASLAKKRGAPVTRASLAEEVLAGENEGAERTLDVHVSRLRKKLGEAGSAIVTVWGIGYRLEMGR